MKIKALIAPVRNQKVFITLKLRNLEYLIQEAFIGIWRNGIMAVAAITTAALSLAILGAFLLIAISSHRFVEGELAQFQIAAFVPREATSKQAEDVRDAIRNLPLTKNAELLSRDKEWAGFKHQISPDMDLGGVVGNPLPYRIDITAKDPHKVSELAEQVGKIDGVNKVGNAEEDYRHVRAVADLVKVLGIVGAIVLCLTTIFIISNAIRLTLFARRHEIRIMQLVGATNWFIRIPLVLEGIVLGMSGALIASGLLAAGSGYASNLMWKHISPTIRTMAPSVGHLQFTMFIVLTGAAIGALGSMVSIRRFLKI
ncbi:MAG: permease-like cell division protein FtsX [Armatimonadota bacterium]